MKKVLSLLLIVSILLSAFAGLGVNTYAATPSRGQCGDNVYYTFNSSTGELVISGTGAMWNYDWDWYMWDDDDILYSYKLSPFYYDSSIKKVEIQSGVTSIGDDAFDGCSGLTNITIPNSVTSIGIYTFYGCSSLTSITIPNSVTSIGNSAFEDCSNLTSIMIPNSVTSIGDDAFYGCSGLTNITIPSSLTSIGYRAFYGCSSLKSVLYLGTKEQWNNVAISSYNTPLIKAQRYYLLTTKLTLKHSARTANAIKVSWNKVNTASGYQVQISTKDGKKWSTYANLKAGVTSYTFKKLAAGNNYKFRVRFYVKATDGKNYYSPWSKTLSSPTLPAGTQFTKVKPVSKTQLQLSWKKVSGVTGYQVQVARDKAFKKSAKIYTYKGSATTSKKIGGFRSNTWYYQRVRTYKKIGGKTYYSAWSKVFGGKMPK